MESTRDITERKTWERRQELMVSELSHRVKNTLAVVQSFAAQSIRGSRSPEEFTERFEGRLAALARAHLLLIDPWKGADVEALAREQLGAYVDVQSDRLVARGDPAILPADLAVPLGLALHELATNAVKHGSWSSATGRVELDWTHGELAGKPALTVVWRELGGPVVGDRNRPASAATIEKGLPNSRVRIDFLPTGLVCRMEMTLPESVGE